MNIVLELFIGCSEYLWTTFVLSVMAPGPIKINHCIWKDYLATQESKLPALPEIEDVSPRITRVLAGNPGLFQLQGTNTYLVGTGQSRILIDSGQGFPFWINTLVNILEARRLTLSHVLLTHWHSDHTGGVPDLIRYNPEFTDRIYKNSPDHGQRPIEDGQVFQTEGATVKAVFTPGHASDHMCFLLEEENALFTGDNVLGHGYSVLEDLGAYMESLDRMYAQQCSTGYPAHGAIISHLPSKILEYIRHKRSREQQIYVALASSRAQHIRAGLRGKGSLTIRELVQALHGEVPSDIYEMALEPLTLEILKKLAEDRKVGFELGGGNKRWFVNQRAWERESMSRATLPT